MYIEDINLFEEFLNMFSKVVFIKREDNKKIIKQYIKDLIKNEKSLLAKKSFNGFIPKQQQQKITLINKLWEVLLKEAIYCLRDEDSKDINEFKQDFGISEIKEYFEKFSDFEEVLYGTDRYYRDHSLHVIRVFFLGFYLLVKGGTDLNFDLIKIFQSKHIKIPIKIEEKQAIWTVIALTHDLGYPIEKIDRINKKITSIIQYYGPSDIQEFQYHLPLQNQILNDFILKFISSKLFRILKENNENGMNYGFHTVIQNKYYLKFAKAFENFSHGIMSCILLMKHLVYFKESDYSHSTINSMDERDAKQFLIRKTILRSIASHDTEDIYHIFPNNFLFMLSFCDDLQEWDRPNLDQRFSQKDEKIAISDFNFEKISFSKHFVLEHLEINKDLFEVFSYRIKKYIKLFRSGPKSNKRPFTFTYTEVVDRNNKDTISLLKFQYPPDSQPIISIPLLNEHKNYLSIFLDFIEDKFISEKIDELIKDLDSKFQESKK